MKQSTRSDLEVYEFGEDHEEEKMNFRLTTKLSNPKFDDSPSTKYKFLHCVAQGSDIEARGSGVVQCVDVVASDDDHHCSTDVTAQAPFDMQLEDSSACQLVGCEVVSGSTVEQCSQLNGDIGDCNNITNGTTTGVRSPGEKVTLENDHIRYPPAKSLTNSGSVNDTSSDAIDSKKENSPSPTCLQAEKTEGCVEDHMLGGFMMEDVELTVSIHADYIAYQDKYYAAPVIIFSDSSVRIEGLVANQDVETFIFEWGIDDIFCIESQWCARVNVVRGRLCLMTKGFEEIKFAVFDPEWSYRQEELMSLNVRYKAAWKILSPLNDFDVGDALPIDNKSEFFSRPYLPNFDVHFKEVIYPEGDVDAVSISKRDVDLLQPETFINDTIIDFYIKYLKNKILPEEKNRFHFFNSFFFRKLADLDKNPDSAFDGKVAFQRVRKWTRKLNLFEKDYIFIPVNYNLHWSLIVICHPGEVAGFRGGVMNESSKVPCILHMDSIRGSHSGLKNLIQSYLCEEWKERQKDTPEDISTMFMNLRFLSLELPQQENCYDCGLFLLHYVELFVADAPSNFNPFKITKYSNFLTEDWFMPAEVSLKRAHIQRLIHELLKNRSRGGRQSCPSDELDSSALQKDSGTDHNAIGLISENGNAQNPNSMNTCYSGSGQEIDISLLGMSSFKTSQCISQPGLALFEPGRSSGSFFGQYQQYDIGASYGQPRGAMSPIEEEDEADEHIVYSAPNASNFRQLNFTSEGCNNIEFLESQLSWGEEEEEEEGVSNQEEHEAENSSEESGFDSNNEDLKFIEDGSRCSGEADCAQAKNQDPQGRCPLIDNFDGLEDSFASASSDMMETPAEGSPPPDSDGSLDNSKADLAPSTEEFYGRAADHEELKEGQRVRGEDPQQGLDGSHKDNKLEGAATCVGEVIQSSNQVEPGDVEQLIVCDSSDSDDEPKSAKRVKLSPSINREMKLTGSLFKDVQL